MNPFEILNINEHSNDQEIRKQYLNLIRVYSPDSDPKRFRLIHQAYELIKNEELRRVFRMFNNNPLSNSPMGVLANYVQFPNKRKPLGKEKMQEFLQQCVKIR